MKLLICEWNAFMQKDFEDTLTQHHIAFKGISYNFTDVRHDDYFKWNLMQFLHEDHYDAVFSFNFIPIIAEVCQKENILYLAWSYDNPLDVENVENYLGFSTNRIFLFDQVQYDTYKNLGFDTVFHLPLAASTKRLDAISISDADRKRFSSEISFIGKLYASSFDDYLKPLSAPLKDTLLAMVNSQTNVFDKYFLDDMITKQLLDLMNGEYKNTPGYEDLILSKEALSYAMAAQVTRLERLVLLHNLAEKHQLKVYSHENNPYLEHSIYMGTAQYYTEMPKIFKLSKINLNINLKNSLSGLPLRVIDIMGAGGFLLTNHQAEYDEHFVDGRDLVIYHSIEEAMEQTNYYLTHDEERSKIAVNGYNIIKEYYSYERQIAAILNTAGLL